MNTLTLGAAAAAAAAAVAAAAAAVAAAVATAAEHTRALLPAHPPVNTHAHSLIKIIIIII